MGYRGAQLTYRLRYSPDTHDEKYALSITLSAFLKWWLPEEESLIESLYSGIYMYT